MKNVFLFLIGAVLALGVVGCNGGGNASSSGGQSGSTPDAEKLILVSPHSDSIRREFERVFKQKKPNVTLQWVSPGGSSDILRYVLDQYKNKENKDEGIEADVFFGGGMETFLELEAAELLQPLPSDYKVPAAINGVPLRGKDNHWVGAALSGFGILYNKQFATRDKLPVPVVWGDMGKPELAGRVELADPRKSGSAHVIYEIILQTNGWDNGWKILAAMSGNARAFNDSSSQVVNDVSSGEAVFAPCIDMYARAKIAQAGAGKIGYVEPRGQSVVTPDPIGILRGAKNKKLAEEFIAFVLSPEGQKLWMLEKGASGGPQQEALFRMPVLPSLYQPIPQKSLIGSNPFAVKNARPYDYKKAGIRRQTLDDLIGAILIDNHDALKARQKEKRDASTLLLAPSEAEVMQAAVKWSDTAFSQQKLSAWREAAAKKISSQ